MFVNGIPFAAFISQIVKFVTVKYIEGASMDDAVIVLKVSNTTYKSRRFTVL